MLYKLLILTVGASQKRGIFPLAVLVLALGLMAGACGSSSSRDSASTVGGPPKGGLESGRGSSEFKSSKPADIVNFGSEGSAAARMAASKVLSANLAAREAADFSAQCETLGKRGLEAVLGPGKAALATSRCPGELRKLALPLRNSRYIRRNRFDGSIVALRVQGNEAYALYHGTDRHDYAMRMEQEGGQWKVGALTGTALR
jgi:hypothetical protein